MFPLNLIAPRGLLPWYLRGILYSVLLFSLSLRPMRWRMKRADERIWIVDEDLKVVTDCYFASDQFRPMEINQILQSMQSKHTICVTRLRFRKVMYHLKVKPQYRFNRLSIVRCLVITELRPHTISIFFFRSSRYRLISRMNPASIGRSSGKTSGLNTAR